MQPYNPAIHGVRPVHAPAFVAVPPIPGVAKPSPIPGLVQVQGQYVANAANIVHVGGSPVASTQASQPAPAPGGGRGQFWNLPRFQPPSFEGANGMLPCPDSPGSSSQGSRTGDSELNVGPACTPPHRVPSNSAMRNGIPPLIGSEESEYLKQELPDRYPIGALVEYHSRSSGAWILSRVEGFDEKTGVYRLTVQPNAKPERIRPHYGVNQEQIPLGIRGPAESLRAPPDHMEEVLVDAAGPVARENQIPSSAVIVGGSGDDFPDPSTMSVDTLLRYVSQLHATTSALQKQLAQETALKEQYYSQMCICRDQLQRVRDTSR